MRQRQVGLKGLRAFLVIVALILLLGSGSILADGTSWTSPSPEPSLTLTSHLQPLTISQTGLRAWLGDPAQRQQSLGSFDVFVLAAVNYKVEACYEVSPTPWPPFAQDPLKIENPPGSGSWDCLTPCPTGVELLGFSGSPNAPAGETETYPTEVDLSRLGDRKVGEGFSFSINVVLTETP